MRDTIQTARLTLRPVRPADGAEMVPLLGDWDVARMTSRIPHPYTAEDFAAWRTIAIEGRSTGSDFSFVAETYDGSVIGCAAIHKLTQDAQHYELGYWIGRPYWGKGYATEAGRALLDCVSDDLGSDDVMSRHFVDNPKSGRVLEKLGFRYTGKAAMSLSLARGAEVECRLMVLPRKEERP
jgi:RimJ/RimL family protein N-acetyltransferase